MRLLPVVGLVVVAASCGGAAPAPVPPRPAPAVVESFLTPFPPPAPQKITPVPPAKPVRSAELHFRLNRRDFHLPLVRGTVGGEMTWMLVDTGANSHMIASWLAKKAGLKMTPLGALGTDHTGRAVKTYSVENPKVAIEGWGALDDGPMLVTEIPKAIERIGIGAFISPQWLTKGDEAIVLDLAAGDMHSAGFDEAVRALGKKGKALAPTGGRLCEDTGAAIKGLAFVLPSTVEGRKVQLLLDTGAHKTDILTSSRVGIQLLPRSIPSREQMYAASGLVRPRVVKGAEIRVGDFGIKGDVDLIPGVADPVCPRDGVVSMDVLRSCVLVLGKKQMAGRCVD